MTKTDEPQAVRSAAKQTDKDRNVDPSAPLPAGDADDLVAEERAVKREELAARMAEAQQKIVAANAPWWRGATPLTVAVAAGALTLLGNIGAALYTGRNSLEQEKTKADAALAAEKEKNKAALIIQAVSTSDPATARRNVLFFVESGFFEGQSEKIKQALDEFLPVLPSNPGFQQTFFNLCIKVPQELATAPFKVRHIRNGAGVPPPDDLSYKVDLLFPPPDQSGQTCQRLMFPSHVGVMFKVYVSYDGMKFEDVEKILENSGYENVSKDSQPKLQNAWFTIKDYVKILHRSNIIGDVIDNFYLD